MKKQKKVKVLCGVDGTPCGGRCKKEHSDGLNVYCERLIIKEGKIEIETKVCRAF